MADSSERTLSCTPRRNGWVLVNRPFSIWERVNGETLGSARLTAFQRKTAWHEGGQELVVLHGRVRVCPDARGYLDTPGYQLDLVPTVERLVEVGAASPELAREILLLIEDLAPHVSVTDHERCFVHNDLHAMNVMCTRAGALLALVDWGDAGWGDPALAFAAVPLQNDVRVVRRLRRGEPNQARLVSRSAHRLDPAARCDG